MSSFDEGIGELLREYTAARALVKSAQARVSRLSGLKRKKGDFIKKWDSATTQLAAAKSAAADLKERIDDLRAVAATPVNTDNAVSNPVVPPGTGSTEARQPQPSEVEGPQMPQLPAEDELQTLGDGRSQTEGCGVGEEDEGPQMPQLPAQDELRTPGDGRSQTEGCGVGEEDEGPQMAQLPAEDELQTLGDGRSQTEGCGVDKEDEGSQMPQPPAQDESQTPGNGRDIDGDEGSHKPETLPAQDESQTPGDGRDIDGDEVSHKPGTELPAADVARESNQEKRQRDVDEESEEMNGPRKKTKKKAKEEEINERAIMSDVNSFLLRPYTSRLNVTTRAAIRTHQTLAPAAATTYRTLALDVLTTNRGNVLCPYHQETEKKATTDSKHLLNGVPLPRMVVDKKKTARSNEAHKERLVQGHLHCGCETNAALWDFFFWKSLTLTAEINGKAVTEPVSRWTPRDRIFFLEIFEKYTFLTVDDLYSKDRSPDEHEESMLIRQLNRILERVNELRKEAGEKKKYAFIVVDAESDGDGGDSSKKND